jgi:hypothetical protein
MRPARALFIQMIDKYKDVVILSEALFSGAEGPAFAF